MATQPMPERVTLCFADGWEIPVDCVYAGDDKDGTHVWIVVQNTPLMVTEHGGLTAMKIGKLPAHTSVVAYLDPPSTSGEAFAAVVTEEDYVSAFEDWTDDGR